MGDTEIFYTILSFLLIVGAITPFLQDEFNTPLASGADTETILSSDVSITSFDDVGFLSFFPAILGAFTWSFGALPWVFELIFLVPLRILFIYLGVRLVRGV